MAKIYNEEQLNILCREYQKVFYLQDWIVNVSLQPQSRMMEAHARCAYNPGYKTATIKIPTPDTYISSHAYQEQDMQHALIHELIHLHFTILDEHCPEGADTQLYEQGINMVSRAFVDLLPTPQFDKEESKDGN